MASFSAVKLASTTRGRASYGTAKNCAKLLQKTPGISRKLSLFRASFFARFRAKFTGPQQTQHATYGKLTIKVGTTIGYPIATRITSLFGAAANKKTGSGPSCTPTCNYRPEPLGVRLPVTPPSRRSPGEPPCSMLASTECCMSGPVSSAKVMSS